MALTEAQKVTVAEIARESYSLINSLASSLNASQEASILVDVTLWGTIRNSHVRLKGGSDGLDFDNERKREAIRQRIRKAFGLPLISSEIQSGSVSIRTVARF